MMYRSLQAFFVTEDDAEDARATLNKLKTNDVMIDHLPEGTGGMTVVPLAYSGNSTQGLGTGNGGIIAPISSTGQTQDHQSRCSYMLDFKVDEADFQEALRIVMEKDGRVPKEVFDQ